MMREAFIGFDSAWTGRVPGAASWALLHAGRVIEEGVPECACFDDVLYLAKALSARSDYLLLALDQPIIVPNHSGQKSRPVDRLANALLSRLRSGAQSANRGKTSMFGNDAPIWAFLSELEANHNPWTARSGLSGRYVIEVFPALSLPALIPETLARRQAARYNPSRKTFSPDDWRLVTKVVRDQGSSLGLHSLRAWVSGLRHMKVPRKPDQDRLDAAICLILALRWRLDPDRQSVTVIGDERGYMVTLMSSETKQVLEPAAATKAVSMDEQW